MRKYVIGDFKDNSAIVYKKENHQLVKGLLFEDGTEKWFEVLHFGDFHNGLAIVDNNKKVGYINRHGDVVIPTKYIIGDDFSEERAFVTNGNDTILIDTKGQEIRKWNESLVTSNFSNNLARVDRIVEYGEKKISGFIDRQGEFVIPFIEEKYITSILDLIDEDDKYSDGLIRMKLNEKYGFIDDDINTVIPFIYDWTSRFENGIAAVCLNDKYGFIDKNNDEVIPFVYDDALNFSEGLASVMLDGQWGVINIMQETVIPFEFDGVGKLINGEIPIRIEGKWGLVDVNRENIIEPIFDSITHFNDGICQFTLKNKKGVMDRSGNSLISDLILGSEVISPLN